MEIPSKTSGKIKLLFFGLTAVAVLSFVNFVTSFQGNPSGGKLVTGNSTPLPELDKDTDHDGLTDTEESYWNTDFQNPDTDGDGFLDGEEVASGHDPLIPGPNDLLSGGNITDQVADLIFGGLSTGDLKLDTSITTRTQHADNISLAVLHEFFDSQPAIQKPAFIFRDNSPSDQEAYLSQALKVMENELFSGPGRLDPNRSPLEQPDIFIEGAIRVKKTRAALATLGVPKDWQQIHAQLLDILLRLEVNYRSVASSNVDPLKAVLAITEIENIRKESQALLKDTHTLIIKNNLKPTNDFFEVISLIFR